MRILLCLLSILVFLSSPAQVTAQAPAPKAERLDDNYGVPTVISALNFLHRTDTNSVEIKEFLWPLAQLGDAASIATLKILGKDDLIKRENASLYLIVARNAFSGKSQVLNKSDLDPKVTLFILSYLEEKEIAEPLIERRISYVKRCVTDFSCSSQSEYNFLHEHPPK
jgi:hypothetical protein